jgi:membrane protein DedA with SNARE-associated domain
MRITLAAIIGYMIGRWWERATTTPWGSFDDPSTHR